MGVSFLVSSQLCCLSTIFVTPRLTGASGQSCAVCSPWVFTWSSWCVCLRLNFPFLKGPSHVGLGPTPTTSLQPSHLRKDPVSNGGHLRRCWDSDSNSPFFSGLGRNTSLFFFFFSIILQSKNQCLIFCQLKSLPCKMLLLQRSCLSSMFRCRNIKVFHWVCSSINLKARGLLCLQRKGFFVAGLCPAIRTAWHAPATPQFG